ncbi:MAG: DUF2478 domain-containing protein [Chloroflexi bacterium]|nr:DUF2478 domain-containing protein [Chloroflexota bacterium]
MPNHVTSSSATLLSAIPLDAETPTLALVTGPRGAGKTTLCHAAADEAARRGWSVRGLLSPPVFEHGQKIAINLVDLATRPRAASEPASPHATADWSFDPAVLAWGDGVLRAIGPCDVLIIDELGPLEFERGQGWVSAFPLLDARRYRLALVVVRPALLDAAQARWPGATVLDVAALRGEVDQ